ncbi:hypothetical protein OB955_14445 [Halobacteria archaeon AArc-m2/3/4]|uniref:Uncharacterized protein n=1 Tax=Natronoglomus mannanivorans TaxID=2979990 RepID=A0ABT2QG92_9EURY|nr:hypothetical protein [Halobacteria archaeon AArc-m2/3/4]
MTRSRLLRSRLPGAVLVGIGLGLIANPTYMSSLTIYPGTSWGFLPLFHAAFSALGLLAVWTGWFTLRHGPRVPSTRQLIAIAAITVVAVPLYGIGILVAFGSHGPILENYGIKRAFVASLAGAAFVVGCGLSSRRYRIVLLGFAVPLVPLGLVILKWRSGALLGPVVDIYFLATAAPVLEIPYLGSMLLLASGALGVWIGRPTSAKTTESKRHNFT